MPINPITAYRLAAQAERANEALSAEPSIGGSMLDVQVRALLARLKSARQFGEDQFAANARLHADLAAARDQRNAATVALATAQSERDDLQVKIARMTSWLRQNVKAA